MRCRKRDLVVQNIDTVYGRALGKLIEGIAIESTIAFDIRPTRTADQRVVAQSTLEAVEIDAAVKRVIAITAKHLVTANAAEDIVVAEITADEVVSIETEQIVVAAVADQRVVAIVASNVVGIERTRDILESDQGISAVNAFVCRTGIKIDGHGGDHGRAVVHEVAKTRPAVQRVSACGCKCCLEPGVAELDQIITVAAISRFHAGEGVGKDIGGTYDLCRRA